jgi:hypothetical protein
MTARKMINRLDSDKLPNLALCYKQVRYKTQEVRSQNDYEAGTGTSLIRGGQKKENTNTENDLEESDCHDANLIQLSL